jgi:hypothetical protein
MQPEHVPRFTKTWTLERLKIPTLSLLHSDAQQLERINHIRHGACVGVPERELALNPDIREGSRKFIFMTVTGGNLKTQIELDFGHRPVEHASRI